ncbi:nitric oxide synthase 1-like [Artemia franciscana]|uniref:nitric oxide synthase 1-like n=1 Tax=Artemia franciscana TaxID=6661 RepID=UPI0032DB9027
MYSSPCTVQIRLSWQDLCLNNPVSFEPGDHLGILSENADEMVSKVIQKLNPIPSLEQTHRLMIQKELLTIAGPRKEWVCYENLPPATVFDWFKKFLDITTPPTQSLLYDLATYATDPKEKEGLDMLSQDVGRYEQWKHSKWPTVLSFLEEFSSLSIPAEALIIKLPLMKPRFYSISSCLLSSPTCVDLTVGAVKFITEDGSSRNGLCSMYLNQATIGTTVNAFFRSEPRFHLPENPTVPIIMVGPGTGIAPFRSFWMHRAELMKVGQHLGAAIFYGGYRTQELDLYREEKWKYHNMGAIELAATAYSREVVIEREFVQHKMMIDANARRIYELLDSHGGHIYVCGDFYMANDVKSVIVSIFQEYGNINADEAASAVENLINSGRYHEDIFGITVGARKTHLEYKRKARLMKDNAV